MTDRAALLKQAVRRLMRLDHPELPDNQVERYLIFRRAELTAHAEFALSLAEATRREDVQRCRQLQASGDAFDGEGNSKAWARAAESLADQMEACPITLPPIGDADKGRVE
ncbi:MAG TPA: hypothetical protein VFG62_25940 [Rhodopila sp.]|jgi:hypothetical protein|nr:hypothetical protein [Rhodopila sp.]